MSSCYELQHCRTRVQRYLLSKCLHWLVTCKNCTLYFCFCHFYTHSESKENCATIHSFITVANVGRFPKFFHCCILQEICNRAHANIFNHTFNVLLHYQLQNLKFKIQPFSVTVLQTLPKMFYLLNVTEVQWVTMGSICCLYSHTQKSR